MMLLWLGWAATAPATESASPVDSSHANALDSLKFTRDEDVPCIQGALEAGDPATGPSTYLLKVPKGCEAKWHYHTAQEQVSVLRGLLRMEMEGHEASTVGFGGFAVMQGGVAHQFSCTGPAPCLLLVSFDGAYDITWGKKRALSR